MPEMQDFDKLYEKYFRYVYQYVRRLSHNDSIADEITSDTFFKALSSLDGFRGECDIRVWLCQIAKNSYFSYMRKNKRFDRTADTEKMEQILFEETPEGLLLRKDELSSIRSALHDLHEPYKEVFMWRVLGELSFSQIGRLFSKSENWACVTYHRARKMIQKRLEENDNNENNENNKKGK